MKTLWFGLILLFSQWGRVFFRFECLVDVWISVVFYFYIVIILGDMWPSDGAEAVNY